MVLDKNFIIVSGNKGQDYYSELLDIYHQTTSSETNMELLYRYLEVYFEKGEFALCLVNKKVIGYCCFALTDSLFVELNPYYRLFSEELSSYPYHLHINFHPNWQGKGVGSELIHFVSEQLILRKAKGLHLVTATSARNVSFYLRNGFEHLHRKNFNQAKLSFLSKALYE